MDACSELGEPIERHLRGAAPPAEDARVVAHLEACADCRDYVQRARRIEAELVAGLELRLAPRQQWDLIQMRLRSQRRGLVALGAFAIGAVALAPFEYFGRLDDASEDSRLMAAMMLVMGAGGLVALRQIRRRIGALQGEPGGLLAWARRQALRERRASFGVTAWFAVTGVMALAMAVGPWADSVAARVVFGAMAAVQATLGALSMRRVLALRGELQVLA